MFMNVQQGGINDIGRDIKKRFSGVKRVKK